MHVSSVHIRRECFPAVEEYPFNLPIFKQTSQLDLTSPVTFFVGENGSGKSTLLEALAHACSIYIWRGIERTRYQNNPHERDLFKCIDVDWVGAKVPGSFFASQIFRNFSQILDEWAATDSGILNYFGGESLMTQSHGQSLMAFFKSRFMLKGVYLVDEPETALSPQRQIELLHLIQKAAQTGDSQFIIATHSPILLACPHAKIYDFNKIPVSSVTYTDTEQYRVYKDFLMHWKDRV